MADARLLVSRSKAEAVLDRHLGEGRELQDRAGGVATQGDYETWDADRHRWVKLTKDALRTVFAGDEIVREFEVGAQPLMVIGASVDAEFEYRKDAIRDAINTLVSLRERLEYLDAPAQGEEAEQAVGEAPLGTQIFVVHGRQDKLKERVARLLEKAGDYPVTILHEQPNEGKTLIEKFEEHAAEVAYAVVLLTGDDEGGLAGAKSLSPRARQNVIFELGFFFGAIRRSRIAVLYEAGVELPSDISGVVYLEVDDAGRWEFSLVGELRAAGLDFDLNKLA